IGTSEVALAVARAVVPDRTKRRYVDLRAREADGIETPERVKVRVLTAVGVVPPRARSDGEARAKVRAALRDGQVLVLDNVRTDEQLAWLGLGAQPIAGAYVVVAGDLRPRTGIEDLPVGPLDPADGLALLRRGRLAGRVADGPDTQRLARYLRGPAVVRLVRRWLEARPGVGPGVLLAELEGRGSPPPEEPTAVLRAVLELQTAGLPADSRRLLALLPHLPVTFLTVRSAGALLDRPAARAERALDELARAALLEAVGGGRYRIPREARTLGSGSSVGTAPSRLPSALGRLVAHYAEAAGERAGALAERWMLPAGDWDPAGDAAGAVAAAEAWFRDEDLALLALLRMATRKPLPARATPRLREVADALDLWFRRERRPRDREAAAEAALAAAVRLRDPAGRQTAQLRLAAVARAEGRLAEAGDHLAAARPTGRGPAAAARWATGWGVQQLTRGDVDGARATFEANLARRPGRDAVGRVTDLLDLGAALLGKGELDPADGRLRDAARIAAGAGDPVGLASAQELLGVVAARRGRTADALEIWSDARLLYEQVHDEPGQARCLLHAGTVLADRRPAEAVPLLRRSLELRDTGTGVGVAMAHLLLAELETPDDHRDAALAALAPWQDDFEPPAEVAELRLRLNYST
ncbi:MAG TPA: tetratricopeptide repeat protein, partial [Mycobacteriales bacterium]